jgi:hypothetical protein
MPPGPRGMVGRATPDPPDRVDHARDRGAQRTAQRRGAFSGRASEPLSELDVREEAWLRAGHRRGHRITAIPGQPPMRGPAPARANGLPRQGSTPPGTGRTSWAAAGRPIEDGPEGGRRGGEMAVPAEQAIVPGVHRLHPGRGAVASTCLVRSSSAWALIDCAWSRSAGAQADRGVAVRPGHPAGGDPAQAHQSDHSG